MPRGQMRPEDRARVSAAGGKARAAGDPEALAAARAAGGRTANRAPSLARRIAEQWPGLTRKERADVWTTLGPLMSRARRAALESDGDPA